MNTVFLPKVTDVFCQYLGLAKPEMKSEKVTDDELKSRTDDLLSEELEAVSPESRRDGKNEESNLSLESMKVDEDESPPFEPLDEDNSIDSHMSGISGLQSHNSNSSLKSLQKDDTHISEPSCVESATFQLDEDQQNQDTHRIGEGDSNLNSSKSDLKKDEQKSDENSKSESKSKYRSEDRGEKNYRKHDRSKVKDKYRSKDRDYKDSDKNEKNKNKDLHKTDRHKDEHRDKDKYCSTSSNKRERDSSSSYKRSDSKSKDDKVRSKHNTSSRERKSSSSRSEKNKDKERKVDRKDDHYGSKHRGERRSTDRDSNDGSGLKSSSSSYCESNSSSQHSQKESTNSNDSNQGEGNSDKRETKNRSYKDNQQKSMKNHKETECIVMNSSLPPTKSVSAATWDAVETQLNSNINYDTYYPLETELNNIGIWSHDSDKKTTTTDNKRNNGVTDEIVSEDVTGCAAEVSLKYFSQSSIETDECDLKKATKCLAKLEKQIQNVENCISRQKKRRYNGINMNELPMKQMTMNNAGGNPALLISNDSPNLSFHLPLSPAESDSDKSIDKKTDELPIAEPKRRVVTASKRYSSDDLYKPRLFFKRTTTRQRRNIDE